jgi:TolA-binding protein
MSHILQIVINAVLSVIGLVCIIWFAVLALKRAEDPPKLLLKWLFTIPFVIFCIWLARKMGPFGPFLIVFMGIVLSVMWTQHIAELISSPLANLYDGGNVPPEPKPYYSIALARRKRRQPLEAIVEIRKQLAQFPNDYEGVNLLAAIQAEDLKDLASAEMTFNHFCDWPEAPPKQVAAAFTQLADWHLKLAQDADSARAALEKIIARFPGTELAVAAAQRIAHLGGTEKILLAAQDRQPVALPEGVKSVGLRDSARDLVPKESDPQTLAAEYVKHLAEHPFDTEAREKLAVIYADHYHRVDLAAGELNQLAEMPGQPAKSVAHWLNLLADLQVRSGADYDAARPTLERIIARFPGTAAAELARSRLAHLKLEIKGRKEETPGMKLGVYEQNLGLKYGSRH